MIFSNRTFSLVILAVQLYLAAGCGGAPDVESVVRAGNDSNIRRVANLYQSYLTRNGYRGPADESGFKEYIKQRPSQKLEMMGVNPNNIDAVFISESNGKPFLVRYGIVSGMRAPSVVVVAEDEPGPGLRNVAWTSSKIEQVDRTRFEQLWNEKPVLKEIGPPTTDAGAAE